MTSLNPNPTFRHEYGEVSKSGISDNLDNFINWDESNGSISTPSVSPLSSRSKSNSFSTPNPSTSSQPTDLLSAQSNPEIFSGPSHQYDLYKQQAGLPVGAVANTFALNEAEQLGYGRQQSYDIAPTDGYFGSNSAEGLINFSSIPDQSSFQDMDMDFGSTSEMNMLSSSFINPTAISEPEENCPPPSTQSPPARAYPGMHQQAALAKAQEQARQQAATTRPQNSTAHRRQSSRNGSVNGINGKPPKDPNVEESISRLLNQMRHSSVSSPEDDANTPTANSFPNNTRSKKDEEDMDDDERLLNSEEGKKLSSKERRQLRNKVSARAFRSRRKEYIGQLEGELNNKSVECDQLRIKNQELAAENTRLTDLTRMLLSSHHFQDFLADLSGTQASTIPVQALTSSQSSTPRPQPSAPRKDVNPNQVSAHHPQSNMHVGMTMIPEEPSFQYPATESMNSSFTNMGYNSGLYDAQVFAVTSVPEGPPVDQPDFSLLRGKESNFVGPLPSEGDAKNEPAPIEELPVPKLEIPELVEMPVEDTSIEISDAALALFAPPSPQSTKTKDFSKELPLEDRIFGDIELEKAFGRVELIIDDDSNTDARGVVGSATLEKFERLCFRMDALVRRIDAVTAHL